MPRVASLRRSITVGLSAVALAVATGCLSIDQVEDGLAILTIISGNGQTLTAGSQASSEPLVVRTIDNSALPIEGITVSWSIVQGGGTISAGSSTTDDSGNASVTYKPGASAGTAQIKASAEGLAVTFTHTIEAAGT